VGRKYRELVFELAVVYMRHIFNIKNGFTLIELIVVIAIIGFFSSFLLINFRSNQKVSEVRQQALIVVDLIKQAQTMALSGQVVEGIRQVGYGAGVICLNNNNPCWGLVVSTINEEDGWNIVTQSALSKNVTLAGPIYLFAFSGSRANLKITAFEGSSETMVDEAVLRVERVDDETITQCISANALSGRIDLIDCPS